MNRDKSYFTAKVNGSTIRKVTADSNSYSADDKNHKWDISFLPDGRIHVIAGHKNYMAQLAEVDQDNRTFSILINKELYTIELKNSFEELLEEMGMKDIAGLIDKKIRAPMSGQISEILIKEGDTVSEGDPLLSLKAMKMENIIKATADTTISKILVKEGEPVEKNQDLILFQ